MTFEDGMREYYKGHYMKANGYFHALIEQDGDNHEAWNAYGMSLAKMERYNFAADAVKRAISLDPNNITYQKNLEMIKPDIPIQYEYPEWLTRMLDVALWIVGTIGALLLLGALYLMYNVIRHLYGLP
ncbi:hypothetical protein KHC33_04180 [Methanospirillum sp. J.3.6.1-F.2.7.3]|uniref:Tetratricopeptide repeat protein n=1 Tax=Methanospirillum purgamenti TaxID=2834276 RepID=A0A8E7AYE6_9EURY|nr:MULTISPECIES: hypothetical protein [Methanospirillum]MDX8551761.1 hypothetical protein [Methanospirillum hungatei]QVV89720.1 hypothetical protein KHC33_04180 [Methanospirillum sp. J.3.6.1-F.2.7.3]